MPEDEFCSKFILKFENKTDTTRLDESAVFKSFYGNEHVVEVASKEACALMDIGLAKCGPEAIAESCCNCMRCQQCPGEQSNWFLHGVYHQLTNVIRSSVSVYLSGDDKIKGH